MRAALLSLTPLLLVLNAAPQTTCTECSGTLWYVDADAPAGGTGTSWATAFRNLRTAINASSDKDCIWVAEGTYPTTSGTNRSATFKIDHELAIYGGFDGTETCLAERAGLYRQTILTGDIGTPNLIHDNAYNVVTITGPTPVGVKLKVRLDGFRIEGAHNDGVSGEGGAFHLLSATLTLRNCIVRDNFARLGGAIHDVAGTLDVAHCRFRFNEAQHGGALWCYATDLTVYNSRFAANRAGGKGGVLHLHETHVNRRAHFMNVVFHDNLANRGGVAYLKAGVVPTPPLAVIQPGRVSFTHCTLTRNGANSEAAALLAEDHNQLPSLSGGLVVENSIVWANTGASPQIVGLFDTYVGPAVVPPGSVWAVGSNISTDPFLQPFSPFRLAVGSPAIDRGDPNLIRADVLDLDGDGDTQGPTPWDFDGRPRIQDATVDLGATEH